eukprot:397641-Amphidinium_carterae.1
MGGRLYSEADVSVGCDSWVASRLCCSAGKLKVRGVDDMSTSLVNHTVSSFVKVVPGSADRVASMISFNNYGPVPHRTRKYERHCLIAITAGAPRVLVGAVPLAKFPPERFTLVISRSLGCCSLMALSTPWRRPSAPCSSAPVR